MTIFQKTSKGGRIAVGDVSTFSDRVGRVGSRNVIRRVKKGTRNILAFNASEYGQLSTEITVNTGDTITVVFSGVSSATVRYLIHDTDATAPVAAYVDASDLLQLVDVTATIDGTTVADGADVSSYLDGKLHKLVLTVGADSKTFGSVGANSGGTQGWLGNITFVEIYDASTGLKTTWEMDSGSTTTEPSIPAGNSLTLTNVAAADWVEYTHRRNVVHDSGTIPYAWVGPELLDSANAVENDTDATTDWATASTDVFESQGTVANSDYAFHANANSTPAASARFYKDLTGLALANGSRCLIVFDARHVGTGDTWKVYAGATNSGTDTELASYATTDTTFAWTRALFTYGDSADFIVCMEANASNNGGIYFDNASLLHVLEIV